MKILFAIKALDDVKGGAERVLAEISSGLAEKDHDVTVVSFDQPGGESFYKLNSKIQRITLGIGETQSKATWLDMMQKISAIRKTVFRVKPDVVIAFMHSTFVPASIALMGTQVPVIASEHIVPEYYQKRKVEFFLLLVSSFLVSKITVLTQSILESYPKIMHGKMVPLANPVNPVTEINQQGFSATGEKIILNVGRLTEQKDQETLIAAFALLTDDYPQWNLRIIGEGELKDHLMAVIKKNNLEKKVILAGSTSHIESEYKKAHIFALSSKYESFGLATAEAMAHSLPVIGFHDCPGTNELIKHNTNGLLVSGHDKVTLLAEGLKKLIEDEQLRHTLGCQGRKSIMMFSPTTIIHQWEHLINEVCG